MEYEREHYKLATTGRRFRANNGILGITAKIIYPYEEGMLFEGYDGVVKESYKLSIEDEDEEKIPFTFEERQEIAMYMIGLWFQWIHQGDYK